MDPRFVKLEEKVTFVEHQLGELDVVVRELGDAMREIARRLDRLANDFEEHRSQAGAGDDDGPSDDALREQRPPHW